MRRITFLALLTLTWLSTMLQAHAQEFPLTPDPATCDAEPIDVAALLARVATPGAIPTVAPVPPTGTPTADQLESMIETVIASVACTNANQPLRALSFFTDDYLLNRISDEPSATLGHLEAASSRTPDVAAVEDRVTIDAITAGPAGAGLGYLEVKTLTGGEPSLANLLMVSTETGWKIDDVFVSLIE